MNTLLFSATLAAALLLAPASLAHVDGGLAGTPKPYCESVAGDSLVHEYGPVAIGRYAFAPTDGSLQTCPYSSPENPFFDGHYDFAYGGTFFVAGDPFTTFACGWPYPDHPEFPTVYALDNVLQGSHDVAGHEVGFHTPFTVAADTLNNVPPTDPNVPNCGDFAVDIRISCVDSCTVPFPAGLDGTYQVLVWGTAGHVWTD